MNLTLADLEERIKSQYEARKTDERVRRIESGRYATFNRCMKVERETIYEKLLRDVHANLRRVYLIEIGAGGGHNLQFFNKIGIPWQNIWANEILADRGEGLRRSLPDEAHIVIENAINLQYKEKFDVVFVSTVFTSILDDDDKNDLAANMWKMLKPGGRVLWYDFKYNNPSNRDVKGVGRTEITRLFPLASEFIFQNVTLAPPIGRKVGKLYNVLNRLFPFLRTHIIALITKK